MDFQLVVVRGRGASNTIKLADGVTTVGRQDECQLRIKSSQVSRKHCELFEKKGLLLVKDLGSSNGTYVNGKRIEGQRVLEPGDELTIGQVTLKVTKAGAQASAPAAPSAPKAGDTAVSPAIAAAAVSAGGDDDFDIEFDDDFDTPEPISLSTDEPLPAAAVPVKEAEPTAKAKAEPEPAPQPDNVADDAVADFLLDIKFDEDE
jgi:predicted component of type VI protein secretion system